MKVISGLWLGMAVASFLFFTGHAVDLAFRGVVTAQDVLVCLVPLGFVAVFCALTG